MSELQTTDKPSALDIRVDQAALTAIQEIVDECSLAVVHGGADFGRTFAMAAAYRQIGDMITEEMMADIMLLQGSPLGFMTDKDTTGGYPLETIKQVVIEATLRGFAPVGNEFNIIAGRFYGAKAGFIRKVREFPGIASLEAAPSAPEKAGDVAFVPFVAAWTLNGVAMRLERIKKKLPDQGVIDNRIIVKVNTGLGLDAILGKATRKMYRDIYDLLVGATIGHTAQTPEGEVDDAIDVPSTSVGNRRVEQSTLFDGPADTAPVEQEIDVEHQGAIVNEYIEALGGDVTIADVGRIAKGAGVDARLTKESKKQIMDLCTKRRGQVK